MNRAGKKKRIRWTRHVACLTEKRHAHDIHTFFAPYFWLSWALRASLFLFLSFFMTLYLTFLHSLLRSFHCTTILTRFLHLPYFVLEGKDMKSSFMFVPTRQAHWLLHATPKFNIYTFFHAPCFFYDSQNKSDYFLRKFNRKIFVA
jgi:hypothetical protein